MFCHQCGQPNPEQAVSCAQCGNPLTNAVPAQPAAVSLDGSAAAVAPAVCSPETPAVVLPPLEPRTDGKAVASLIFGIVAVLTVIFLIGIVLGIPAIILGHISHSNIKKSMGKLKGAGIALAGMIMGYISLAGILVLPFILIIAAIAIPNLLKARIAANEASAVASVRTIDTAAISYQLDKKSYPSDLAQLQQAGLIDATLASGLKSGYKFTYVSQGNSFFLLAAPVKAQNTGTRNFCSSEDAVVHFTKDNEECTVDSPPLL